MDHPLPRKVSQILSQMRPASYDIVKAQENLKPPKGMKLKIRLLTNEIIDQIILKNEK